MNFIDTTIFGFIFSAGLIIFLLARDLFHHRTMAEKIKNTSKKIRHFFAHRRYPFLEKEIFAYIIISILSLGIILSIYARFIEVYCLKDVKINYDLTDTTEPIKIIWLTDLQVGNHKKDVWVKKIIKNIEKEKPDLIILGGDIIDNEGSFIDETVYLEPFSDLFKKYPTYYILGNHEYGIGSAYKEDINNHTANRVQEVKIKMADLGAILIKNQLYCPKVKEQKICLYGLDEIWANEPNFDELEKWDKNNSLILLTHNPDGITYWPENYPMPDLTLAGHTHGGQIYLPFYGPLGNAGIQLDKKYYRGEQKYKDADIYISVGAGESGGAIRFGATPELTVLTIY